MSKGLVIGLGVVGTFVLLTLICVMSAIGVSNGFIAAEEGINAQYDDNRNSYDRMWKTFKETAQVSDMYATDLERVFKTAITAREGEGGSKALFKFVQEQNPNFDSSLYTRLQAMIEAGRNSFAASQTTILDKCRVYKTSYMTFPNSLIAGFGGFPRINLKEKCTPVTSAKTEKAFEEKRDEEVKLR
jgi:hypothetical protein